MHLFIICLLSLLTGYFCAKLNTRITRGFAKLVRKQRQRQIEKNGCGICHLCGYCIDCCQKGIVCDHV